MSDTTDMPQIPAPVDLDPRELSLYLAVLHHGLAASNQNGKPSSKATVLNTAHTFYEYLLGETHGEGAESVTAA